MQGWDEGVRHPIIKGSFIIEMKRVKIVWMENNFIIL